MTSHFPIALYTLYKLYIVNKSSKYSIVMPSMLCFTESDFCLFEKMDISFFSFSPEEIQILLTTMLSPDNQLRFSVKAEIRKS